jgi:aspartyl-tRNA(Asn)/glutamyl-tRNA(Gln) amidotransferase subunit B
VTMNVPHPQVRPEMRIVIGLEIHVQLKTETKLFCRCSTRFGQPPNTQVCPVCLGLPGALPVLNAQAIELAARAGSALHCELAPFTKWDRKNYFYPDLPKGYQTSQFDLPICVGGYLDIPVQRTFAGDGQSAEGASVEGSSHVVKRIRLVRAHLEEDAGKSMHDERAGRADTRIDLNRAGTPLLEIVSEPDLSSAEEAKDFLTELRLIMVYLGITDGNMQEGSLRADANVNLHFDRDGQTIPTPIVEIKNLNSFRAVERAIHYEVDRQYHEFLRTGLAKGQSPKQTRGWNDALGQTELQREKEEAADYRYFPCPDLVPVILGDAQRRRACQEAVCTPSHYRTILIETHGLKPTDAGILIEQGRAVTEYFLSMVAAGATAKRAAAWMLQDVLRTLNDRGVDINAYPIDAAKLAQLLSAIDGGRIDTSQAKQALAKLLENPTQSVDAAIESLGIVRIDVSVMETLCRELLAENPDVIDKVKAGNTKAVAALVGQAKKKNRNADPRVIQEICLKMISEM